MLEIRENEEVHYYYFFRRGKGDGYAQTSSGTAPTLSLEDLRKKYPQARFYIPPNDHMALLILAKI